MAGEELYFRYIMISDGMTIDQKVILCFETKMVCLVKHFPVSVLVVLTGIACINGQVPGGWYITLVQDYPQLIYWIDNSNVGVILNAIPTTAQQILSSFQQVVGLGTNYDIWFSAKVGKKKKKQVCHIKAFKHVQKLYLEVKSAKCYCKSKHHGSSTSSCSSKSKSSKHKSKVGVQAQVKAKAKVKAWLLETWRLGDGKRKKSDCVWNGGGGQRYSHMKNRSSDLRFILPSKSQMPQMPLPLSAADETNRLLLKVILRMKSALKTQNVYLLIYETLFFIWKYNGKIKIDQSAHP